MADHVKRLTDLADGWECAAEAEHGVVAFFQQWKEQFDEGSHDPSVIRKVRVWCEARDNAARFEKDAAAIRWALSLHRPDADTSSESDPLREAK